MSVESVESDFYRSLTCDDAQAAIEWLCRAFGFVCRLVVAGAGGRVEHSELSFGSAVHRPGGYWA